MRTTNRAAIIISALLSASACGSGEDAPRREPPPVEETAFKELVGAMDKAHGIEDVTKERAEQLDQALEESESR